MEGRAAIESIHKRIGHILVPYKYYVLVWSGFVGELGITRENPDAPVKRSNKNEKPNRAVRSTYCPTDIVWFYNCLNGMWSSRQTTGNIPEKTSGSSAAVSDDYLYIFGGMIEFEGNTQRHRNDLYRLHIPSLTWEKLSPLGPKPPHCDKGVGWAFDGKLYFYGGYGPRPDPSTMDYVFHADIANTNGRMGWNNSFSAYDPIENKWFRPNTKGRTPDPRAAHSVAIVSNRAFIFGGRFGETRTNDVYYINLETLTWSQNINAPSKDTGPEGRSWLSFTFVSRKKAVVYGGLRQYGIPAMDYWECEFSDNYESLEWTKCVSPIEPRIWHQAAFCENTHELVIVGGVSKSPYDMEEEDHFYKATTLKYDPESQRSSNDAKLDFNSEFLDMSEIPNSSDNPLISDFDETLPANHSRMNLTGDHDAFWAEETPRGDIIPTAPPFSPNNKDHSYKATILKYNTESLRSSNDAKLDFNSEFLDISEIPNSSDNPPISDVDETLPANHSRLNPTGDHDASWAEETPRGDVIPTAPPFSFNNKVPTQRLNTMTFTPVHPMLSGGTSHLQPSDAVPRNVYGPRNESPFRCSTPVKTPEVPSFISYITPDVSHCKNITPKYPSLEGISYMTNTLETPRSHKPHISVTAWHSATEQEMYPSSPKLGNTIITEPFSTYDSEYYKTPIPMHKTEKIETCASAARGFIKNVTPKAINLIGACMSAAAGEVSAESGCALFSSAVNDIAQIASSTAHAYETIKPVINSPNKPGPSDLEDRITTFSSAVQGAAQFATASIDAYEEIKPLISQAGS